jgi:hypothetical protein
LALPSGSRYLTGGNVDAAIAPAIDAVSSLYNRGNYEAGTISGTFNTVAANDPEARRLIDGLSKTLEKQTTDIIKS